MVDWSRVAELREEIGADDFDEVVALFLEETDEVTAQLARGIGAHEVEEKLHFLKGSALNLGMARLAALCHEGERLARAGNGAAVDLARVVTVYEESKTAYLSGLSKCDAA